MYKKTITLLLGAATLMPAFAQTETGAPVSSVTRGASVALEAPAGYTHYQWQVSTDGGRSFYSVPGMTEQQTQLKIYTPMQVRVEGTDAAGKKTLLLTRTFQPETLRYHSRVSETTAAHAYVETLDGKIGASGINIPEAIRGKDGIPGFERKLTRWDDPKAMAVNYFFHPAFPVDTKMVLTVQKDAEVVFRLTVSDPTSPAEPLAQTYLTIKGTGKADTLDIMGLDFPRADYFRYQLECLQGNKAIKEIDRFLFRSTSSVESYKANYLSSPSVHLGAWRSTNPRAPQGAAYDWCYQEVMIPQEYDVQSTYAMSLGVLKGYMGIQHNGFKNGEPLHEVIFSMWDDGSTDENPNLPANLRAGAVDWNTNVEISRFGGEGTGAKSFIHGNQWESGKFVQFITNSRQEQVTYTETVNGQTVERTQNNTLVTAWYNAQDGKGWQYISTLRLPNGTKYFDSWYSFLENYNPTTGQALRKAYYRNGYARSLKDGKWFNFNKVNFGNTDGSNQKGARRDYGQGRMLGMASTFFMSTGGYIKTDKKSDQLPANSSHEAVDTINLEQLLLRVDEAVANEKKRMEIAEVFQTNLYQKDGWKLIKCSSEETNGEGANGRARLIIDGKKDTYWHSRWTGSQAPLPHVLVVDTQKEIETIGAKITMSGGSRRYIKAFDFFISNDNQQWEKVYSTDDAPNEESFHFLFDLPQPAKFRYFKIHIRESRDASGPFVRINEIDFPTQIPAAIESVPTSTAKRDNLETTVTADGRWMDITVPADAERFTLTVYDAEGRVHASQANTDVKQGQIVRMAVPAALVKACIVQGQTDTGRWIRSVLLK